MEFRKPKFLVISALCGGMGVLSGYAIFLTYHQVMSEHTQARFLLTLLITAIISYAIEWIREVIREGKIERAAHPILRTVGTFLIVLMFELFILGFHATTDLTREALRRISMQLLGNDAPPSANWTLVMAGGLWIVVGALLAAWLSQSVNNIPGSVRRRIWLATRNGLIGGLIFAPVVMALYIFGGRCLVALLGVFQDYGGGHAAGTLYNPLPDLWHNIWVSQNSLTKGWFSSGVSWCALLPLGLLAMAAQKSMDLFMACFFAMAACAVGYPLVMRSKFLKRRALQIVLGVIWVDCLVYTLVPFCMAMFRVAKQLADKGNLETLGAIVLLPAVIWAVPGGLLGALTPLLRRVSAHTRNWAFVGYGSALLLIVATLWAQAWWPLVPAVAAAAVGYMFQRGSRLYEYWPFAALCVAAGVCGATSLAQHMTFAHEVLDLHAIDMLQPAPASQPAIAGMIKSYDQLSPTEQARVPASPVGDIAMIHADDGQVEFVALRKIDAASLKEVQEILAGHQAEIQRINDSITRPPPPPPMPSSKDMPTDSSFIDAAVAGNRPGADGAATAAAKPRKAKAAPASDGLPGFGLPDVFKPQSSPSSPSAEETQSATQQEPAAASAAAATPSTPAPASSAKQQAASTGTNTADDKEDAAKALELSLSGSVGFWVTVGLLACWSMEENDESEGAAPATAAG